MHNKNSKRQRKHKASQSLKGKQQAPRVDALDLLGEELQQDSDVDECVATLFGSHYGVLLWQQFLYVHAAAQPGPAAAAAAAATAAVQAELPAMQQLLVAQSYLCDQSYRQQAEACDLQKQQQQPSCSTRLRADCTSKNAVCYQQHVCVTTVPASSNTSHGTSYYSILNPLSCSCRDLGTNALILPAGKPGSSGKGAGPQQQQQQQQLSKSQLKKLRQVQLKKERRQQLSEVRDWQLVLAVHLAGCYKRRQV
jgi:hypothetical protein